MGAGAGLGRGALAYGASPARPFGVVGFTPSSGEPSTSSMHALAALLTAEGQTGYLVGASTGEVILRAIRTAYGLETIGAWDLTAADGTEFDGDFTPAASGAAGPPSIAWQAPGASGGLQQSGGGYLRWGGWAPLLRSSVSLWAGLVWVSLPGTPANFDGAAVGLVSAAAGRASLAGTLYTSGTAYRTAAAIGAATSVDPASATTANTFAPSVGNGWRLGLWRNVYGASANNATTEAVTARVTPTELGTVPARPSPGVQAGAGNADQAPCTYARAAVVRWSWLWPTWGGPPPV